MASLRRYFRYLVNANELALALHLASELRSADMCAALANVAAFQDDNPKAVMLRAVAQQLQLALAGVSGTTDGA